MQSVFINGLGLIGASLVRIIKKSSPNIYVMANDLNPNNLNFMKQQNLVNEIVDFKTGVEKADLIILATPVKQISYNLLQITNYKLRPGALITDVGSNKERILESARKLMSKGINFLGGHPMAGSHLSGSNHSSIKMLANHTYFLVNGNATNQQIAAFKALLSPAHFHFNSLTAQQHDLLVSATSHLPHLIAFTLINTITPEVNAMNIDPGVPSGGLLDTTRIAQANPDMWTSIMTSEDQDLLKQIDKFEQQLKRMKIAIQNHDSKILKKDIKAANQARRQLEEMKK